MTFFRIYCAIETNGVVGEPELVKFEGDEETVVSEVDVLCLSYGVA